MADEVIEAIRSIESVEDKLHSRDGLEAEREALTEARATLVRKLVSDEIEKASEGDVVLFDEAETDIRNLSE